MKRFWSKVEVGQPDECWEWQKCRDKDGYGEFSHLKGRGCNPKRRYGLIKAHRFAWMLIYGDIPNGLYVLHRCDNPPCCNPFHLFIGTNVDNVHDRWMKGRGNSVYVSGHTYTVGVKNGSAKLTENDVINIRREYAREKTSQYVLARKYNVSQAIINGVVLGKIWKHVK